MCQEGQLDGLITKPEPWFQFLEDRNLTVHTYNHKIAEKIYVDLALFDKEVSEFIVKLKELKI